jgi:hypothetical protein
MKTGQDNIRIFIAFVRNIRESSTICINIGGKNIFQLSDFLTNLYFYLPINSIRRRELMYWMWLKIYYELTDSSFLWPISVIKRRFEHILNSVLKEVATSCEVPLQFGQQSVDVWRRLRRDQSLEYSSTTNSPFHQWFLTHSMLNILNINVWKISTNSFIYWHWVLPYWLVSWVQTEISPYSMLRDNQEKHRSTWNLDIRLERSRGFRL